MFKVVGTGADVADAVDAFPDLFGRYDAVFVACTFAKHYKGAASGKLDESVDLHTFFGELVCPVGEDLLHFMLDLLHIYRWGH